MRTYEGTKAMSKNDTQEKQTKRYYYMPIGNHVLTEKQILFKYTMDEIKAHAIYLGEFPSRKLADRFNAKREKEMLTKETNK